MLKVGFFLLFLYIFSESKTAANNKKKDTKATGENATSTDAQSTNQNVGRFRGKFDPFLILNFHQSN